MKPRGVTDVHFLLTFSPILQTENDCLPRPSKILQGFKSQSQIYMEADLPLIQQSHNTYMCIA